MIELTQDDGLWTVTLNNPEKANALTSAMLGELVRIAEAATEARALILTGAGRVFSAGADLEEARAGLATSNLWEQLSSAIAALPCLTVAALNGTLAGGANGMVLACDLRIAVQSAKFFYPVMKLGFLPQPSDPKRMAALIGPSRTKMILMAGQKISAVEAYSFGLVDRVVEPDQLMPTAHELVADSLSADPSIAAGIAGLCP
ncbi:Enoyl-CoA hydratase/carnithine racemase [Ruegeria halocynthiae]|uniref:Enoyl-CoA hydratase/carnithine racemase n=1 Tax=Ruegeria halocynthiae TaxID=985054 RepID=A0A1H3C1C6_9RHOB|nr:enoyl-CoA hydratase/isomerase family protein [Ruegeria halocynthiae]SDX47299.1 Enoyl-CoA hydratase/carnithine racemase [Ruegeria halocynthiae]